MNDLKFIAEKMLKAELNSEITRLEIKDGKAQLLERDYRPMCTVEVKGIAPAELLEGCERIQNLCKAIKTEIIKLQKENEND